MSTDRPEPAKGPLNQRVVGSSPTRLTQVDGYDQGTGWACAHRPFLFGTSLTGRVTPPGPDRGPADQVRSAWYPENSDR